MSVVLALCCALSYGFADYCGGRVSRVTNAFAGTAWSQMAGTAVVVVALIMMGDAPPPAADWMWGLLGGAAVTVAVLAFYHAMGNGAMTVVAPTTAIVSAVLPVVVGLIEGERPGSAAMLGIAAACIGVALVSGLGGRSELPTAPLYIAFAAIGGAGFGMSFIALDRVEASTAWPLLAFRLVSVPVVIAVARLGGRPLAMPRQIRPVALVGGALDMGANLFFLAAIRTGLLSVTSVLASLYPVSTVVLALSIDRERVTRLQVIGMVLVVASLALVAFGRSG